MARVFLHVGAHKTGTSFLQSMFHQNRALLARDNIYYPDLGPNNAHHALARAWIDTPDIPDAFFGPGGVDAMWDRLIDTYASTPGTLFLSAENFSRVYPKRVDMADLARRLAPFDDMRIIYTMRRQTEMISSVWTQAAKTYKTPRFGKVIKEMFTDRRVIGVPIDHNSVYSNLRAGFAPEQITLLDYAALCAGPEGVLGAFLKLLGSTLDPTDFAPLKNAALANISPDPITMYLATRITRNAPPPPNLIALIHQAIRPDRDGPTSLLTRAEYKKVQGRFTDSNRELTSRVQPVQPGFTFEADTRPPPPFCRDDITDETWIDVANALYEALPSKKTPGPIRYFLNRL